MRIVFITSSYPCGDEDPPALIPEMEVLCKAGNEILVVPAFPRGAEDLAQMPAAVQGLFGADVRRAARRELRRDVRMPGLSWRRPRVALKNLIASPKALWLTGLARKWGAHHVHACWSSVPATLAWAVGERTGIPWSFSMHRWDIEEDNFLAGKLRAASFARAISLGAADDAARVAPGAPPPRMLHIGVRIPPTITSPSPSKGRQLRALVPANLIPRKGHDVLLQSLAKGAAEWRADFAGDGSLRGRLEERSRALGLSGRVTFQGRVRHAELLNRLRRGTYDAVVLPSEHEGIPAALMEAMAAGVPVVGTTGGSTPELVQDGCGLVVPPGEVDLLTDALDFLAEDETRRRGLGEAGRSLVERDFNVEKVAHTLGGWIAKASGSE